MSAEIKNIYERCLEACLNGRFHQDLRILYQVHYRNQIDWTRFPAWAIPNAETEGCHEG